MLGCGDKQKTSELAYINPDNILEGDTIILTKNLSNLISWLDHYSNIDTGFKISNFKASGVILHYDSMRVISPLSNENEIFTKLFSYSQKHDRYIDIWTYGNLISSARLDSIKKEKQYFMVDGEADQQVVLGDKDGKRKEVLFNGPSQFVETADWLNNDQFLLTMFSEEAKETIVEIFLFDLKSEVFTNYRLNHGFIFSNELKSSFKKNWLANKKFNIDKR
jgi:hypothetical protein